MNAGLIVVYVPRRITVNRAMGSFKVLIESIENNAHAFQDQVFFSLSISIQFLKLQKFKMRV